MFISFVDPTSEPTMIISGLIIATCLLSSLLFTQNPKTSSHLSEEFVWSYNIVHVIGMIAVVVWGHNLA
jgi:hypothetical protein